MKLFIVESPSKIKTIKKFLGPEFQIEASLGHIREMPPRELGVDLKKDYQPTFQLIETKQTNTRKIVDLMQKAEMIYLAQDLDREGELIAWHLMQVSDLPETRFCRVVFHEITKSAVQAALLKPRPLNQDLVGAGLARTILDRIIGYRLSPLIWKRFESDVPLSIGRVQTVALYVLAQREHEIRNFVKEEFYDIRARYQEGFEGELVLPENKKLQAEEAQDLMQRLIDPVAKVKDLVRSEEKRRPKAPFTTASLIQEASTRLRWKADHTMKIAQQLYEGVDLGSQTRALITYMRTDAVNLSQEAIAGCRQFIETAYGKKYLPKSGIEYKNKTKNAQEAHEAIRPVDFSLPPKVVQPDLSPDHFKLYQLIWNKTIASQMNPALQDQTVVLVDINGLDFRSRGSILVFDGFLRAYDDREKQAEVELPPLQIGQVLKTPELSSQKKFTKPPPRYNVASLTKMLEKNGIGRPSTYAGIMTTLQKRKYASVDKDSRFTVNPLGHQVVDWVHQHFEKIVNLAFTAEVEDSLDEVAKGNLLWVQATERFYSPLRKSIFGLQGFLEEDLDQACPKCQSPLKSRPGRFGPFLGCSAYPACDYIHRTRFAKSSPTKIALRKVQTEILCEICGGKFDFVRKYAEGDSKGDKLLLCSNYPRCTNQRSELSASELSLLRAALARYKAGEFHENG